MEAIDTSGNTVPFSGSSSALLPDAQENSLDLDGPGTFRLEIVADNDVTYTIIVCQRAIPSANPPPNGNGNKNNKNKKNNNGGGGNNKNHKKHRHHHGGNNPFNNPFRQYARNNGNIFNEQYEDTFGNNDVSSQQSNGNTSGSNVSSPQAGGDTFGNGGVSASSGPGGAQASTPGAVAQSGNPDQQQPVSGPQGKVVNEIPTQGPLPNTGGLSFLAVVLPAAGFLLLCVVVIYRIISNR